MDINKIKDSLQQRFNTIPDYPKKRHIIFWYDDGGSFKDIIDEIELPNIKKVYLEKGLNRRGEEISTNIFELKYELEVLDKNSNFLIYSENGRPEENRENFLLDIELYSEYFEANKSAMIIEEFNFDRLNYEVTSIVKEYEGFFGSKERKEKLKKLLENIEPHTITVNDLELGILASLSNSKTLNIEDILTNITLDRSKLEVIEKWMNLENLYKVINSKFDLTVDSFEKFLKTILVVHFYRSISRGKVHRNLENYYIGNKPELYLFAENLLQNKHTKAIVKKEFDSLGRDLGINERIEELDLEEQVSGISFELFDLFVLKEIAERVTEGLKDYDRYRNYINIRLDNTLWKEKYSHMYKALLSAINFIEMMEELHIEDRNSAHGIVRDYMTHYYKIDSYYRGFYYSYDKSQDLEISGILEEVSKKISLEYEEKYLTPLCDEWANNIEKKQLLSFQKNFYKEHVRKCDTRVAVIISDALRYEVGQEILEKLKKEGNSKEVSICGMITELPSITSLGMANLLPHNEKLNFDIESSKVTIDGIDTGNTRNREAILIKEEEESSAITYNKFRELNRTEQENHIKGKKVIYIYHDTIDIVGDKGKTERNTFNACKEAIGDITGLTKTLSSLGIVNVFITSDHGFQYEREPVKEYNKLDLINQYEVLGKRYALAKDEYEEKGCTTLQFDSYSGVFPKRTQRIKASGGGLQFVHGGTSIQEVLVPLIKFRSGANATRSKKVGVRLKKDIAKITSNITRFSLYQLDAVSINDKIIEREVRLALYDMNGKKVSDEVKLRIDETNENMIHSFRLTLSGASNENVILKVIDSENGDILDSREYSINLSITADFEF